MSRRRPLHPEEEALWQAVARTAKPLHPLAHRRKLDPPAPPPHPKPPEPAPNPRLAPFRLGEAARRGPDLASSTAAARAESPLQMDAKAFARLSRGKLAPEARLDLHGLTLAEAHPDLIRFILNAHANGLRLVLVITGKGKPGPDHGPIPQRTGILRHQVPQWLRQPPLAPAVLQVSEAHIRHGGAGALYVYLRRHR
jgi:DNA-nicking Smr family endonuclease